MARLVAKFGFAIAIVSSGVGCLLAYSDYDNRFQTPGEGGVEAFVTDEDAGTIIGIAVTTTELFYATPTAIKRLPIDGGAATTWVRGTAINDLASDRSTMLAWSTNGDLAKANISDADASVVVSTTLGMHGRLAADESRLAWSTTKSSSCPCEAGGVEAWNAPPSQAIAFTAANAPADIALDSTGVTLFVSSTTGFERFAFDGTVSCSAAAGLLAITTSLHALASGPSGTPFFAIGPGNGSGSLKRYPNACDDAGTVVDSNASGVMTDGTNVYWFTSTNELHVQLMDGGASPVMLGSVVGTITAMTYDDQHVYAAAGTSIFRFTKP